MAKTIIKGELFTGQVKEADVRKVLSFFSTLGRNGLNDWYGFTLRHGRMYEWADLPPDFERMTPQQCFDNCYKLVKHRPGLIYCEGVAFIPDFPVPIHHAWIVRESDGRLIEPTAESIRYYFGVAFSRDYVIKTLSKAGCLLDDWQNRWPRLRRRKLDNVLYRKAKP